jgi:hypothetical protein
MKTIQEITNQEPVYLLGWKHKVDVIGDFEDIYLTYDEYISEECPYNNQSYWLEQKQMMDQAVEQYQGINILFASYGYKNYSGDAWVLFEQNGKLFEVNGSHCSCYGLEGQWEPEEVSLKELEHRLIEGTMGEDDWSGNEFKKELCDFLGVKYSQLPTT